MYMIVKKYDGTAKVAPDKALSYYEDALGEGSSGIAHALLPYFFGQNT